MTFEELVRAYIKLFILILETVGQDIGNKTYQKVSTLLLEKHEDIIQNLIQEETPFPIIINVLEFLVIVEIHGVETCSKNVDLSRGLINDMWKRYLKEPSNKFLRKNGINPIDNISNSIFIKFYERK